MPRHLEPILRYVSYNASAVKIILHSTSSLVCFESKNIFFCFEKRSTFRTTYVAGVVHSCKKVEGLALGNFFSPKNLVIFSKTSSQVSTTMNWKHRSILLLVCTVVAAGPVQWGRGTTSSFFLRTSRMAYSAGRLGRDVGPSPSVPSSDFFCLLRQFICAWLKVCFLVWNTNFVP
jgi:hypothetical protein